MTGEGRLKDVFIVHQPKERFIKGVHGLLCKLLKTFSQRK